jgi:hypothetical protein
MSSLKEENEELDFSYWQKTFEKQRRIQVQLGRK